MLSRYAREEMGRVWSRQEQLRIWYHIEGYACDAMAEIGVIPPDIPQMFWSAEPEEFNQLRIAEIEADVRHETIAFLTYVSELVGYDVARYVHRGLTSSDILDTCFNLQLVKSSDIILQDLQLLANSLKIRAIEFKHTRCMGRSHGVHAEPVTFGLKLARAYTECMRNVKRMKQARSEVAIGKLSGAMGTYSTINPFIEEYVCQKLKLIPETAASQVIPRDRHASYFITLALIASTLERLATELRHMQITEISEIEEGFSIEQKGSSAMPHKKNPILSENITGLARAIRSHATPALENVSLWFERDMSHSSVERFLAPDANITLDFALSRMTEIIRNLRINKENMAKNMDLTLGTIHSQSIFLALRDCGIDHDKAYRLVQNSAMESQKKQISFENILIENPEISKVLSKKDIRGLLSNKFLTEHIDRIFEKIFNSE